MAGQGRAGMAGVLILGLAALFAAAADAAGPSRQRSLNPQDSTPSDPLCSDALRSDAALSDVCFVDPRCGWAVGDRGTIWHTEDGGDRWDLQRSDVACRLQSVFFLDSQTGWAAGGSSHPYLHTSQGVVLATRDGGQHWKPIPKLLLPALKRIRFFNARRGWAIGCPSAMFPSGVFTTDSGGLAWDCLPGPRPASWLAGGFWDPWNGGAAGRGGLAATIRQGVLGPAEISVPALHDLQRMEVISPSYGWLVGQGGLVFVTTDAAASWRPPPGEVAPPATAAQFDFLAVEVRGPKCWVAGSPGTLVFHTTDAGRTWSAAPTGQSLPLAAITFVDDQNGWAVGQLGTILNTADGGRTWRRQRSGGARVAMLGLFSEPRHVPLELFARLSAEEGYLAAVEVLNRRDVEIPSRHEVHPADRIHEALVAVGACGAQTAWQFPLRQSGLAMPVPHVLQAWDHFHQGRGLPEFEAHLVRQIRTWRPDVILTHDPNARGDEPAGTLIGQALLQLADRAADPACFPDQIQAAGLPPWQVKKVYALLPPDTNGTVNLNTSQLAGRLGRSLADLTAGPRGLVDDRYRPAPRSLGFCVMADRLNRDQDQNEFFSGISLSPGSDARRMLIGTVVETAQTVRQVAQRRRNIEAILERALRDPQGAVRLLAEANQLTQGLDADSSAQILFQMADAYNRGGQWPMAAEAFQLLVDRHAKHPLARAALVWLVHYETSAEAEWRVEGQQRITLQKTTAERASAHEARPGPAPGSQRKTSLPLLYARKSDERAQRAAALATRLEQTRPELLAQPSIGFPFAALDRRQGNGQQAERYYLAQRRGVQRDAWWNCAQGEGWLAEPKGPPPKPIVECLTAPERPRLDGQLEDPLWQAAKPVDLRSLHQDDADWPVTVQFACDDKFLYLAIRARQALGAKYEPAKGPRPRDPDLAGQDRVEIYLDLDRDYSTWYRLAIDHRGWATDACWGDSTWNPSWFVAAAASHGFWTAEAAIPLDQLTGQAPAPNAAWAIGLQRIVPGVGFQSFSTPAAIDPMPEGFGYLIFR